VVLQSKKQKINNKEKLENSMPLVHLCSKENNKEKAENKSLKIACAVYCSSSKEKQALK